MNVLHHTWQLILDIGSEGRISRDLLADVRGRRRRFAYRRGETFIRTFKKKGMLDPLPDKTWVAVDAYTGRAAYGESGRQARERLGLREGDQLLLIRRIDKPSS